MGIPLKSSLFEIFFRIQYFNNSKFVFTFRSQKLSHFSHFLWDTVPNLKKSLKFAKTCVCKKMSNTCPENSGRVNTNNVKDLNLWRHTSYFITDLLVSSLVVKWSTQLHLTEASFYNTSSPQGLKFWPMVRNWPLGWTFAPAFTPRGEHALS
jgi:hypothetical protein